MVKDHNLNSSISKAILHFFFGIIILWFLYTVLEVILIFIFAIILALVMNAPVNWLEKRNLKRGLGTLVVFIICLVIIAFIIWLVAPEVSKQIKSLTTSLPSYIDKLKKTFLVITDEYPSVSEQLNQKTVTTNLSSIIGRIGRFSLSFISFIFLALLVISMVVYMVANPKPLIKIYLSLFAPENRNKATNAFAKFSKGIIGWMYSNMVAGSIEAILSGIFLWWMDIPGFLVWASIALFAELIPKIGAYIMALPPILIALTIDPVTAFWVALFYITMNELVGNFVIPKIRASTMNLHPVSSLIVMLALGSAFGIPGALIATPVTAIIKAFYEEFYLNSAEDKFLEKSAEMALLGKTIE